jgi:hypothetical protein
VQAAISRRAAGVSPPLNQAEATACRLIQLTVADRVAVRGYSGGHPASTPATASHAVRLVPMPGSPQTTSRLPATGGARITRFTSDFPVVPITFSRHQHVGIRNSL